MNENEFDKFACKCYLNGCDQEGCRHHIDYPEDNNCCLVSIEKHGSLSLREVAERLGISYVRVKQIEDAALKKLSKTVERYEF
jgi:hypothetical protein